MLSDEAPLTITEPITRPSIATAASADSVARTAKISWTIRRRRRPAERTVTSYGAHEIAPRERSKRRTTACAATFVISEITSRIAAR